MINGTKIKQMMRQQGISNREMANSVGVSEAMMTYITQELRETTVTVFVRIARKLGCTLDELVKQK